MLLAFVFVLAPLFGVAYGAKPLIRLYGERASVLQQQRELLAREKVVVTHVESFDALTDSARRALEAETSRIIRASEMATAHVELTDHLRSIARRSEVLVTHTSAMTADSSDAGLTTLRMALRAESDLAGLARFLDSVSSDSLALRISRILIEMAPRNQFGGSAVVSDGRHVLLLSATVEALAQVGQQSSSATR